MAVELGAGYVSLTVEARNVARDITTKIIQPIERAMARLGTDAGRKFSTDFAEQTRQGLGGINLGSNLDEGFGRLGTDAGNDFARQFEQETSNLGDSLGRLGTDAGNDFARQFEQETNNLGGNTTQTFIKKSVGISDHGGISGTNFAGGFGHSSSAAFGSIARGLGAILIAGIAASVAGFSFAKGTVDLASNFVEQTGKIDVVFGESGDVIKKWAETAAVDLGVSQVAALETAGTFGNLFKAIGIGTDTAAEMTTTLVQRAVDVAALSNTSAEEVLTAINAGLVGETEPLRKFGSNLNDARIKAEAFRLGLVQAQVDQRAFSQAQETADKASRKQAEALTKYGEGSVQYNDAVRDSEQATAKLAEVLDGKVPDSLTASQKAQAAYSLILADTAIAQGNFGDTSDQLAGQQKILGAEFDDLKVKIGTALLPAALTLVTGLRTKVLPALERWAEVFETNVIPVIGRAADFIRGTIIPALGEFADWLGPRLRPAIDGLRDLFEKAQPKFEELGRAIRDDILPPLKDMAPIFRDIADFTLTKLVPAFLEIQAALLKYVWPIILLLVQEFGRFLDIMNKNWEALKTTGLAIATFVTTAKSRIDDFITTITGMPGRIAEAAAGMWDPIKDSFRDMLNTIIGWWNSIEFKLPALDIRGRRIVGGQTIDPPNITPLATGGVVTRPTLAMIGETSRATPEIVTPQAMMAETFRDELRRFSPMSNMAPVRIEHFHSTEPSRTVLEEMQWRIATGVL